MRLSFGDFWQRQDYDRRTGDPLPPEKSHQTLLGLVCELEHDGAKQQFMVFADIYGRQFDLERLAAKTRADVADYLRRGVIKSLFDITWISVLEGDPEIDASPQEVEPPSVSAEHLVKELKDGEELTKKINDTVDKLREVFSGGGFLYEGDFPDISKGIRILRSALDAHIGDMMTAWRNEKLGTFGRLVEDLRRRKNANHPNYRSAYDHASGVLYGWNITNAWKSRPYIS